MTKHHPSLCCALTERVCVLCGKKPFLVQNVKINIVFNVILFWPIQECNVCCQKCHLEQGAFCDYGESCESCQVLQLPSPSAYCYETLFYATFKRSVSNLFCSTVSFWFITKHFFYINLHLLDNLINWRWQLKRQRLYTILKESEIKLNVPYSEHA